MQLVITPEKPNETELDIIYVDYLELMDKRVHLTLAKFCRNKQVEVLKVIIDKDLPLEPLLALTDFVDNVEVDIRAMSGDATSYLIRVFPDKKKEILASVRKNLIPDLKEN